MAWHDMGMQELNVSVGQSIRTLSLSSQRQDRMLSQLDRVCLRVGPKMVDLGCKVISYGGAKQFAATLSPKL
jgi:hypothetical protein